MKVSKIIYFGTYPVGAYWQKIGLEAEIIEGDDVRQCLYDLKKQIENFHYESTKAAEKERIEQLEKIREGNKLSDTGVATIIQQINTCTELKVLESYKFIVKKDADLQAAYDKKYKQLQTEYINK